MAQFKNTTINDTGFLQLPSGTIAQRPATAQQGQMRFNTTLGSVEWYDSEYSAWFPTGFVPPAATGGTVTDITQGGVNYRVHSFTTVGTNTFTVTRSGPVEFLIVAGGGSGGVGNSSGSCVAGSGGGAGGILTGTKLINAGNFLITVGQAGQSQTQGSLQGNNGENSNAFGFTAIGGGGGGCRGGSADGALPGKSGGSGGGGNHAVSAIAGSGTPGQGNSGGHGFDGGGCLPGTGGGAGFPGQPGFRDVENAGGKGLYFGNLFTENFGENGFFAGGGAAGINGSNLFSRGGLGGAVDQPLSRVTPNPGLPNSGAGGCGGASGGEGFTPSGAGGSGIVLIRYRIS